MAIPCVPLNPFSPLQLSPPFEPISPSSLLSPFGPTGIKNITPGLYMYVYVTLSSYIIIAKSVLCIMQ